MPSKSQTGSSPLGNIKLGSSSGFVRTEQEMARRTPTYPSDQVWINLPNGRMYRPNRARGGGGGRGGEWKVSLSLAEETYTATVAEGKIYSGLLNPERITFETEEGEDNYENFTVEVVANDVVCIKYTYATTVPAADAFVTIEAVAGGTDFTNFEPTEDDGADPPETTATRYPLAKIIDTGEVDADANPILAVEQMATNNLAKVTVCINGEGVETFTPI